MLHFDCVVIGAGISGMTASIYLKRAGINVLLIEKNIPGGQINRSSNVENYPGFLQIDGPSLSMSIYNQITEMQIPVKFSEVTKIDEQTDFYEITLLNEKITTTGIILATGREPRKLNLDYEEELIGHGISYCAICDGTFYKDKAVGVVGGGNSAIEESIYLSKICKEVVIFVRNNKLKAEPALVNKIKNISNVKIYYNSEIEKLNAKDDKLSTILYKKNNISTICQLDGLFLFVGNTTNLDYIKCLNINIANGNVIVDSNMRTNKKNIYACGDVIDKELYQLVTASSDGAIAANSFIKDFK